MDRLRLRQRLFLRYEHGSKRRCDRMVRVQNGGAGASDIESLRRAPVHDSSKEVQVDPTVFVSHAQSVERRVRIKGSPASRAPRRLSKARCQGLALSFVWVRFVWRLLSRRPSWVFPGESDVARVSFR
jgi:hypothetical protein